MLFDRLKTLCADDMLDAAGVLSGCLRIHSEPFQPGGEKRMALIDAVRDLFSGLGQSDVTFRESMKLNQFYERDLSYLEENSE